MKSLPPVDFRKFKRFHCEYCSNIEYSFYKTVCRRATIDLLCKHGLVFMGQVSENFDNCLFVKMRNYMVESNVLSYREVFEQVWALESKIDLSQQELDNLMNMLCDYDTDIFMVGAQTLQHLSINALKYLHAKFRNLPALLLKVRYNKKNINDLTVLIIYYVCELL